MALLKIPKKLHNIFQALQAEGGRVFVTGGAVRDAIMHVPNKDMDIEVYGITYEQMPDILQRWGKAQLVGKQFAVVKLAVPYLGDFDFSLPRREVKTGVGNGGFEVMPDPDMNIEEALLRRDFTMNAIMWNPADDTIIDPYDGIGDIQARILRATSSRFAEDSLRVLRAFQFVSRFDMQVEPKTLEMCKSLKNEFDAIPVDRIWCEWEKWAEKAIVPSRGLQFLRDCEWLEFFPELAGLVGLLQDSEYHPEGTVWNHTLHTCDVMRNICVRDQITGRRRITLMFAALCHDFGKVTTTGVVDGRLCSPGHDVAGEEPTRAFARRIRMDKDMIEDVATLVKTHMRFINGDVSRKAVGKLMQVVNVHDLALVMEADHNARPPLPKHKPAFIQKMLDISETIHVDTSGKFQPILLGRHLIDANWTPGKHFSVMLKLAEEAQLAGKFNNEETAVVWFHTQNISEKTLQKEM